MRPARLLALVLCSAALAVLGAGCGGSSSSDGGTDTGAAPAATTGTRTGPAVKVGLVTDIGGLNDRSFNHLAYQGLQRAERELGVEGRVIQSRSPQDYVPNLSALAKQHYDLVVGVGFLMADAMSTVAKGFPKVNFAIIDFSQADLKGRPANVQGLLFEEQEAGYLVGYLAGLVVKQEGGTESTISSVGGLKIPPVDHYIAGYRAGARAAFPKLATLNGYSQDFVDQAKCKEVALDQIARGSQVVFQVAGQCGLGALDAAKERNVWGIGVDADQGYLGAQVLTSALKKVDVAVYKTIQQVQDGSFRAGEDTVFDAASGGVGIGKISSRVPSELVDQLRAQEQKLADGTLGAIPDTVK